MATALLLAVGFLSWGGGGIEAGEVRFSGGVIVEQVSSVPYAQAVAKIEAAIKGARLVVVGEPNYQMMQRMVGRERKGAKAYFIFRPDLGTPIFDNDPNAAMEIPLKILIMEGSDGKTVIRYKKPSSVLADYKGLSGLGQQLDDIMAKIAEAGMK
ncbi:DUF302 domain-containing protein [Nitrospira sp. Kam-Ns4a]